MKRLLPSLLAAASSATIGGMASAAAIDIAGGAISPNTATTFSFDLDTGLADTDPVDRVVVSLSDFVFPEGESIGLRIESPREGTAFGIGVRDTVFSGLDTGGFFTSDGLVEPRSSFDGDYAFVWDFSSDEQTIPATIRPDFLADPTRRIPIPSGSYSPNEGALFGETTLLNGLNVLTVPRSGTWTLTFFNESGSTGFLGSARLIVGDEPIFPESPEIPIALPVDSPAPTDSIDPIATVTPEGPAPPALPTPTAAAAGFGLLALLGRRCRREA